MDSKVTLVAYEQALSSEDEQARQVFMKQHVDAVKSQIKKLAEQDYDQLPDLRSLDFVLLFVPIESAFTLAMELEPKTLRRRVQQTHHAGQPNDADDGVANH